MLNHDDANGEIMEYRVCYKPIYISGNLCLFFKTVGRNTHRTTLSGMKKYTMYDVAVQAATVIGFGPPGTSVTAQTLEDIPGPPKMRSVSASLTTIYVSWYSPQPNGRILKYVLCWNSTDDDSGSCRVVWPSFVVSNLKPGTMYNVTVSAFTKIGEGPAVSVEKETDKSDLDGIIPGINATVCVFDETRQIGFMLPPIKMLERQKIKYFYIIVKRWDAKEDKNTFLETPESQLTNFYNSTNGKKAYIAIINDNSYESNMEIIVGDNSNSSFTTRKNTHEYRNVPLMENTQYAIFIRVSYDNVGVSYSA